MLCGLVIGAIIVTSVPAQTPDASWFIVVCGALAICAMVVPGISGSFVLLLLGKYAHVIDAIGHFRLAVIVPFAAGAVIGLASFSRLLSFILHRYERQSLMGIAGVLCASLWVIWPFQQRGYITVHGKARLVEATPLIPEMSAAVAESAVLMAIGFLLVLGLQFAGSKIAEQS
jgi:putative membrane protein